MKKVLFAIALFCSAMTAGAYIGPQPQGLESETTYYGEAPDNRIKYSYDERGLLVKQEYYYYSSDRGFHISSNNEFTYDDAGRILSRVTNNYNESKDRFEPRSRRQYTYNADGLLTLLLTQTKKTGYDWTNDYKEEYTYTTDGQVLTQTNYNMYAGRFQVTKHKAYTYDANGRVAEMYHKYVSDAWYEEWVTYEYNEAGLCIEETYYNDAEHSTLVSRSHYTYDAQGRLTKDEYFALLSGNQDLSPYSLGNYVYNEHGDLTEESAHFFVREAGGIYYNEDWNYKYSYVYDAYGRITRYNFDSGDKGYKLYEYVDKNPSALEDIHVEKPSVRKLLRNGRIELVMPDGIYNTAGQRVD